jgi:hypothetical protein
MGVLLALGQADLSYKPHERSSTAGQIISTIIRHLEICNDLAAKRQADVAPPSADSYKELIREFEEQSVALGKRLSQLKQQQWEELSQLRLGEQLILERPLGEIMWLYHLSDRPVLRKMNQLRAPRRNRMKVASRKRQMDHPVNLRGRALCKERQPSKQLKTYFTCLFTISLY